MARIVKMGGFGMSPNIEKLISVPVQSFGRTSVGQIKLRAAADKPFSLAYKPPISFTDILRCARAEMLPLFSGGSSINSKQLGAIFVNPAHRLIQNKTAFTNRTSTGQGFPDEHNKLTINMAQPSFTVKPGALPKKISASSGTSDISSFSRAIAQNGPDSNQLWDKLFRSGRLGVKS